jgi:Rab3 GTPase-activating protein regulatory subunit N-terminus
LTKTLWGSNKQAVAEKPIELVSSATQIPAVLTLQDTSRTVNKIREAPASMICGKPTLAALSDSLGRVSVLDISEGEIVRMFKGIRNSQCSWISSLEPPIERPEVKRGNQMRMIVYLAIYAPRGVLEVYHMRYGRRVGAFNVGAGIRVVESAHGILGAAYSPAKVVPRSRCFLINEHGKVSEVTVPSLEAQRYMLYPVAPMFSLKLILTQLIFTFKLKEIPTVYLLLRD